MIRSLSFKADPPIPFHTYNFHLKKAVKEGYIDNQLDPEVNSDIIRQALTGLTELFEIPEDYHLVLLQDYSLMVEMLTSLAGGGIIVAGSSVFTDSFKKYADEFINPDILNGDLSTKGGEILLRKDLTKEKPGELPREDLSSKDIREMSLIIQDIDPLTGRKFHHDNLNERLDLNTLSFNHMDISFSSPTDVLNYEHFQSFSFKTKYGFGMDQDLVVWIMRNDLFDILTEKLSGSIMEFDPGFSKSKKCIVHHELQIQRIYILGKIIQDFLNRGLIIIRNETKYKSIILYNAISDNPNLDPLIKDPYLQSQNILCAKTEIPRGKIFDFMFQNKVEFDVLAGPDAKSIIRVANYPVHSKEQMEFLADLIEKF